MAPMKVDGVDYTPEGIEGIRQKLIEYRKQAYKQWPQAIEVTVVLTHVIALLAYLIESIPVIESPCCCTGECGQRHE